MSKITSNIEEFSKTNVFSEITQDENQAQYHKSLIRERTADPKLKNLRFVLVNQSPVSIGFVAIEFTYENQTKWLNIPMRAFRVIGAEFWWDLLKNLEDNPDSQMKAEE